MNIRNINYFFKEAIENLLKGGFVSLTAISTVFISLIILGGFFLVLINITSLTNYVANNFEISVFLKDETTETDIILLKNKILYFNEVDDVKFISKQEALKKMQKTLFGKVELQDILQDNPLPDTLVVKVKKYEDIKKVADKIKKQQEVEKVKYEPELLSKLIKLNKGLKITGFIISIFLGIGTTLLITNTIRLAVFSKRKEIKIMQLIGATDWFIRWPYLLEGTIQGLLGALISISILIPSYLSFVSYIQKSLPFIPVISDIKVMINLSVILVASGMLLGILGSLIALGKFLLE